jgi:hypothetical protein
VGEFGAVKGYLPQSGAFQVLMTTRVRMLHKNQRLDLGVLKRSAAFRLLRRIMADDDRLRTDVPAAKELCEWVGCLPLAIELLGWYLADGGSVADVLAELKDKSLAAGSIGGEVLGDMMFYERNVQAAIGLSWKPLDERAQTVMAMLSVFAIAPIELMWVEACLPEIADVEAVLDRVLVKRSLLEKRGASYQMHPLVREYSKLELNIRSDKTQIQKKFTEELTNTAKNIPVRLMLDVQQSIKLVIPHIEIVVQDFTHFIDAEKFTIPFRGLYSFYEENGLWATALLWHQLGITKAEQRFGENHLDTQFYWNSLGLFYYKVGDFAKAEEPYNKALSIANDQLGELPGHPHQNW